jgi:uncharacterized Fe-S center protein
MFFNCALKYSIRKIREHQAELKLNGTNHHLALADYVILRGNDMETIKRNTETVTDPIKDAGIEVNVQKTTHMLVSSHQNAVQNRDRKIRNESSKM